MRISDVEVSIFVKPRCLKTCILLCKIFDRLSFTITLHEQNYPIFYSNTRSKYLRPIGLTRGQFKCQKHFNLCKK